MRTYFFLLLFSTVISFLLTRWLARVATERNWTRNEACDAGVPRLGGASVFVTTLLMLGLLWLWDNQVADRLQQSMSLALGLAGAAGMVFVLGVVDDLRGVKPWQKLAVQTLAALALYSVGYRVELLTNPFTHQSMSLGWLSLPVTLLWLVAISNAFNLIDGLDGLAAGVGLFATLSLFLLAVLQAKSFVAATTVALAGALMGFLPHNFNPAKIYLGDSGSLTVGMILAALAVESSQKGPVLVTLSIPLLIFGLPLLDAGVTTARRFLSGHPIFTRDEEHLHHRLLKIGLTPRVAVLILYGIAAVFALASVMTVNFKGAISPLVGLLCGLLAWVVVRQMNYPEFAELDSHVRREWRSQRNVLKNQILLRKASAELQKAETLGEAWEIAGRVFESLEFDTATLELHFARLGTPRSWRWNTRENELREAQAADALWTVSLPLKNNGTTVGTLRMGRLLERGADMFRMPILIEFFTGPFGERVAQILDEQEGQRAAAAGAR